MDRLISSAFKAVNGIGQNIGSTASGVVGALHGLVSFTDQEMLAFFAALFAIAEADGDLDEQELSLIFSSPEAEKLSKNDRKILQRYSCNPPSLEESLRKLTNASQELRFGLIFYICNLIWVDGSIHPAEREALKLCQKMLGINKAQVDTIKEFSDLWAPRHRDQSAVSTQDIKNMLERMRKVGIPVEAFAFSQDSTAQDMEYSDEKFLTKMKSFGVVAGKGLVEQALLLWYTFHDSNTPATDKLIIAGALAYWILPIDVVPDVLPVVGFSDDLPMIVAAVGKIAWSITSDNRQKAKQQTDAFFGQQDLSTLSI